MRRSNGFHTLLNSIMCKNKSGHSNPSMQHYENIAGTSSVKFKQRWKDTSPPMLVQFQQCEGK